MISLFFFWVRSSFLFWVRLLLRIIPYQVLRIDHQHILFVGQPWCWSLSFVNHHYLAIVHYLLSMGNNSFTDLPRLEKQPMKKTSAGCYYCLNFCTLLHGSYYSYLKHDNLITNAWNAGKIPGIYTKCFISIFEGVATSIYLSYFACFFYSTFRVIRNNHIKQKTLKCILCTGW